jgi:hypothetical protein
VWAMGWHVFVCSQLACNSVCDSLPEAAGSPASSGSPDFRRKPGKNSREVVGSLNDAETGDYPAGQGPGGRLAPCRRTGGDSTKRDFSDNSSYLGLAQGAAAPTVLHRRQPSAAFTSPRVEHWDVRMSINPRTPSRPPPGPSTLSAAPKDLVCSGARSVRLLRPRPTTNPGQPYAIHNNSSSSQAPGRS